MIASPPSPQPGRPCADGGRHTVRTRIGPTPPQPGPISPRIGPAPGLDRGTSRHSRIATGPALLTVLLAMLLTACGGAPPTTPTAAGPTQAPPGSVPSTSAPNPAPATTPGAPAGGLIWPVRDVVGATRLQTDVDGGRQPWLLDPVDVATSYAGAELGYREPRAEASGPGVVEVRDGNGPATATIMLTQPARRGEGGIWIVTDARRG